MSGAPGPPRRTGRGTLRRVDGPVRRPGLMILAALVVPLAVAGCGVVKKADAIVHEVQGNRATIDAFTSKVDAGEAASFEATYVTTGGAPATVVYAVDPPTGLAFKDTPSGGSPTVDVVVNSSGEYSCTPPSGPSGSWSCRKLAGADAAVENRLFDIYTPAHWTAFLKGASIAAGLAGDKVTSSTMTVNGFAVQCVDLVATGVPGTSTICTTPQGILGYVKVASDATGFEITSYTASPTPALFQLPPGATVVAPPPTTAP